MARAKRDPKLFILEGAGRNLEYYRGVGLWNAPAIYKTEKEARHDKRRTRGAV